MAEIKKQISANKKKQKHRKKQVRQKYRLKQKEVILKQTKEKNIEVGDFMVIQDVNETEKPKVARVLPQWLTNPIYVKRNLNTDKLRVKESCPVLQSNLIAKLKHENITHLFPIQKAVIPEILAGANRIESRFPPRDICVAAPTGSGKTLAYVIPVLQAAGHSSIPALRILVLLPVAELAKQVFKVFTTYAPVLKIKVGQAFGFETFSMEQEALVRKVYNEHHCKVDVLVATPYRLLEHILHTPGFSLSQIRFLILDEADKLLVGEVGDVIGRIQHHITASKTKSATRGIPPFFPGTEMEECCYPEEHNNRNSCICSYNDSSVRNLSHNSSTGLPEPSTTMQRLLFSATLSHDPEQLQKLPLYKPVLFTTELADANGGAMNADNVGNVARPSELIEEWVPVETNVKPIMLHYLLHKEMKKNKSFRTLIFANSVELASKLTLLLKELSKGKYLVEEFSSRLSKSRRKSLAQFLEGAINVLVSSDATARGIDFDDVNCIISYDIPSSKTYIHRIGRTARAGKTGRAISLVTRDELPFYKKMIGPEFGNLQELKIQTHKIEKLESRFSLALEVLSATMKMRKKYKIPTTLKRKHISKEKMSENKR